MKVFALLATLLFVLMATAVLGPVVVGGIGAFDGAYLTLEPASMGREGGIGPIIVNTLLICGGALALVVALGIPSALQLRHLRGKSSRVRAPIEIALQLIAATPSIVFALFGHAFFSQALGLGYSLLSGALTLAVMILPLFVILLADALAAVPAEYGPLAASLGLGQSTFAFKILLPSVGPALLAGLVISWSRALGETAALLFTSGYATRWPESPLDSGRTLSVHIFDLALNVGRADGMVYRAAFVILVLMILFGLTSRLVLRRLSKWRMDPQA